MTARCHVCAAYPATTYYAVYDHSEYTGCGMMRGDILLIPACSTQHRHRIAREVASGPHKHCMGMEASAARVARLLGRDEAVV